MRNKNAFTLIELLAVIVILAVIALIATPLIMGVIDEAKDGANKRSVQSIRDGAETFLLSKKTLDSNYTFNMNDYTFKGNQFGKGTFDERINIVFNDQDEASVAVYENNKCYYILAGSNEVKSETGLTKEACLEKAGEVSGGGEVPPAVSFATDSWSTIAANVKAGNMSVYNVGDTKEVEITGYGTFTVRIANKSTPSECNTSGFSGTACGFVVEFVDVITTHSMNSTNTNVGGWPASAMRSFVNDTIYNALPEDLRNVIADTYVVSSHGSSDSTNFTSTDKLYLLSTKEVWGKSGTSNTVDYDTAEAETRQLDYYKSIGVTTSNYSGAKKNYQGTASNWWVRSAVSNNGNRFYIVHTGGDWYDYSAHITSGVAPAFRLS